MRMSCSNSSDDENVEDWEEVDVPNGFYSSDAVPEAHECVPAIEIEINSADAKKSSKKKKTEAAEQSLFRRRLNVLAKARREELHKTHFLCWLAHCFYLSETCSEPIVLATALSQIPLVFLKKSLKLWKMNHLKKFIQWFFSDFTLNEALKSNSPSISELTYGVPKRLLFTLQENTSDSPYYLVLSFIAICRAIGLQTRLIVPISPISLTAWKSTANGKQDKRVSRSKKVNEPEMSLPLQDKKKSSRKRKSDSKPESEPASKEKPTDGLPNKISLETTMTKIWLEVYLENEQRWIPVNCLDCTVDSVNSFLENLSHPPTYILSVDNLQHVRDVILRYVENYAPILATQRIDHVWLRRTLRPYLSLDWEMSRKEDVLIHAHILNLPVPSTVAELKNHPLYVLGRSLRKFEAFYPKDIEPVGYVSKGKDAFYFRCALVDLHSKETWLKEARSVKEDEEPYKMVKSRLKPPTSGLQKDPLIGERYTQLFGRWQTEIYRCPVAKDGKVPRNEFGNVYLFKPSMLPIGTVHIPGGYSSILSTAKKLEIDCAQAIIGWEFHGFGSHPLFDGVVVCQENVGVLIAAVEQEEAIRTERLDERRHKRALINWKRFVKGLLLRQKIRAQFGLQNNHKEKKS